MAETEPVTFKVAPEVARRLAAAGKSQGKSHHLVAKAIVLKSLMSDDSKPSDEALLAAVVDMREELHQLSDLMAEQQQPTKSEPAIDRHTGELARLTEAITALHKDAARRTIAPQTPRPDLAGIAETLGRQARTLELLEVKLDTLSAAAEKSNVVPHINEFAKKTRKHQIQTSEHTVEALAQIQQTHAEINQGQLQIRHDIAQTLKLMLGYVENISQAQADRLVHKLLAPQGTQSCSPSGLPYRLNTFSAKS